MRTKIEGVARCSFCDGDQSNRNVLLAGRDAYICDDCLLVMITVVMKKGLKSAVFVNKAMDESIADGLLRGTSPHEDLRRVLDNEL